MKTFRTILAWLIIITVVQGCKKDSADNPADQLKNTVWAAQLTYAGGSIRPVSMEFRSGGQLSWNDIMGEQFGSWSVENGTVTVKLGTDIGFSARFSGNNSMAGFEHLSANTWEITFCEKNNSENTSLDNTTWIAPNLVLKFKPGNLVDLQLAGAVNYTDIPYMTIAKSIHFSNPLFNWFLIKGNTPSMKGVNKWNSDPKYYLLEVVKQ
ncbi:MAG: hypothetical protein ABWZ25_00470 [Chitinophagaceae bacterium]